MKGTHKLKDMRRPLAPSPAFPGSSSSPARVTHRSKRPQHALCANLLSDQLRVGGNEGHLWDNRSKFP